MMSARYIRALTLDLSPRALLVPRSSLAILGHQRSRKCVAVVAGLSALPLHFALVAQFGVRARVHAAERSPRPHPTNTRPYYRSNRTTCVSLCILFLFLFSKLSARALFCRARLHSALSYRVDAVSPVFGHFVACHTRCVAP